MKKRLFKTKDLIDDITKKDINDPEKLKGYLSTEDFHTLYTEWMLSLALTHIDYNAAFLHIEKKLNSNLRKLWISFFIYIISFYLFMTLIMVNLEGFYFLKSMITIFLVFSIIYFIGKHGYINLAAINASSVLSKEISLATAVSFDHFFNKDVIKEHYIKLSKKDKILDHESHRQYLTSALTSIAYILYKERKLNFLIKKKTLQNLSVYHKSLLEQFDSRAYLDQNFIMIGKHKENKFN